MWAGVSSRILDDRRKRRSASDCVCAERVLRCRVALLSAGWPSFRSHQHHRSIGSYRMAIQLSPFPAVANAAPHFTAFR